MSSKQASKMSLRLDLVDQQVLDATERPVGRIDEVEMEVTRDGTLRVAGFRIGSGALGQRLGGTLGTLVASGSRRLAPGEVSPILPVGEVARWGPRIELRKSLADLGAVAGLERWLGVHLVSRVPGGGDARV